MIRRGRFVVCTVAGEYGKPRPALVVQTDLFNDLAAVIICPLTTTLRGDADQFRLDIEPSPTNGLRQSSQLMIDKITAVPKNKVGAVIGEADDRFMMRVNRALALMLGLA